MKATQIIKGIVRTAFLTAFVFVLLAAGILLTLYSSWGQSRLKDALLNKINASADTELKVEELQLHFPLKLELAGVSMVQRGDTLMRADTLHADVKLLPILAGNIDVAKARLINGYYQMGSPDTTMWLRIRAGEAVLQPAKVSLPNIDITLDDGVLRHASVDITLRADTTLTPVDTTAQPSTMKIILKRLKVDDLTYRMSMLPTIDSLGANIRSGVLSDGEIDLKAQTVKLHTFIADHVSAAYIAPDSATIAATPVAPSAPEAQVSAPWTVTIDTLRLSQSEALYTTKGYKPQPGLDFAYISASDLDLTITDFYNQATTLSLPLELSATERCGLPLRAVGTFAMDSTAMYFKAFTIDAPTTNLIADGMMGVGDLLTDTQLPLALRVRGYCGIPDLKLMFPGYAPYMQMISGTRQADIALDLSGTSGNMSLSEAEIALPGCAALRAKGSLANVFMPERIGADLALSGHIFNVSSILKSLMAGDMNIAVPPMVIDGHVKMHNAQMGANLIAKTLGGRLALDANLNTNTEGYDIDVAADQFPLHAFMPDMGLGNVTAALKAKGSGFDLMSQKTNIDASADITSLVYNGYDYHDITLTAAVHDGRAKIDADVDITDMVASLDASGNLVGDTYSWTATLDAKSVDMEALKLSTTPMYITASLEAEAEYTPKTGAINASLYLPGLYYKGEDEAEITLSNVSAKFVADDSLTRVSLHNRDLVASASAQVSLDSLMAMIDKTMAVVDDQIKMRRVDVDTLQKVLPPFRIDMTGGDDNLINDILRSSQMSIDHISLFAANDSTIYLNSDINGYKTGSMTLDTIALNINQQAEKMHILGTVNNRPGNMDNWAHIRLDGLLALDRLSLRINQQNVSKQTGFDLGAIAVVADSSVTARLFPLSPIIGYKKWTVNLDNFLYYNFLTHHVDANLKMKGDNSMVQLYTDHDHAHGIEAEADSINNIVLNISDVHLQDWISFNPFAPPITGNLSAQMNVDWDGAQTINGTGQVRLEDFYYDRKKVSTLVADVDVNTNMAGTVRAQAALTVDGKRTMTLAGNLNDENSDSPFNLDFEMIQFPLATVNPFLPEDVMQLTGTLNGNMQISGNSSNPRINGEIYFDAAAVKAAMTNTAYTFSPVKIPVKDNLVTFTDFSIMGANENPLTIDGTVDLNTLTDPKINLSLSAQNMMVVNTQKAARNALIYGKGYLDLKATAKGNMRFLAVNAKIDVLSGTNVTYILTESTSDLTGSGTEGIVKFVNLNDTTAVVAADSLNNESMLLLLDAQLNIQQGTTVTVDLFTGKRDKVQLNPTGYLTYSQSPLSDGRMTGRINLNSGFVRYTLPVIGAEKVFDFNSDSYVAFNGDLLNPTLNIHATDQTKVNVTQEGQNSRLVNFDIDVSVTGTLERMDVAFDLSTDDDLTVANELQSMSAQQRASQAMNMLLYNMYTGPGSSNNINLTANPLFSFLESQINNWAANNIKGVDLSFGIDQYNQTVNGSTSSAMSYSYQVSKTLFNDRFKIVVGGNYTTDANADENLAENLVNDISFEYFLNKQQTMVLRLFRHVGYESILEGEIIQTGVGFVYRKKLDRLANMLPKFIRPKEKKY